MVVGNALMSAFSGGHSALGNFSNTDLASLGGGLHTGGESGLQNAAMTNDSGFGAGGDDAALQDASFDDGGGDFGGGDDSSWT
jgi:hypothetical protein